MPTIQLSQDFHRPKLAVAHQKNGGSFGQQLPDISQQSHLLVCPTVPTGLFDPCPGNWDGSFTIGQGNHQKLMPKSDPGTIHDQMDLAHTTKLRFQPLPGNRLIPFSHSDSWIIQQSTQTPSGTRQLRFSGNLASNFTHTNRTTQINSDDQPCKCSNLGNPLTWTQFHNSRFPGIIKLVDRHWVTPFRKMFREKRFYWRTCAGQLFCC